MDRVCSCVYIIIVIIIIIIIIIISHQSSSCLMDCHGSMRPNTKLLQTSRSCHFHNISCTQTSPLSARPQERSETVDEASRSE